MKNKTNISVKNILGQKVTPSIELGHSEGYVSGDLLDANATLALIKQKIDEVINGASSAADTLKEIEDIIYQLKNKDGELEYSITALDNKFTSNLNSLGSAVTAIGNNLNELTAKVNDNFQTCTNDAYHFDRDITSLNDKTKDLTSRISNLEDDIEDILAKIETITGETEEDGPTGIPAED